ncbi:glycosyltransferase [Williamsia phyllosphaerae]|uniref:Glycosyltransferase involved in cell wall biosynthesis n=1 Tax=Williamsia phyllosphaerae TaxID=885042 RepID=A0ABQ1UWC4_9NOCA|nr:glycosyltransferase [Williamsia phyllosphaerae]GGF28591.1 hypothetical protein GCM10007298_25500 [Williamsia phyllosphaerae]
MGAQLSETRLVYIAPRLGVGGVGDYADDVVDAVRPYFADVLEYRHEGPGRSSVADLRAHRREIRELVARARSQGPTIVHAELSGGALVPFWGIAGLPDDVPVSATVHDPPHPIWWPARTRFMADHWLINHAVHFPFRGVSHRVQRKWLRATTLFVLTESGARSVPPDYPDARVVQIPHLVSERRLGKPPEERPLNVGFFGLVYRGKGFDQVSLLRERLPAEIGIRVAGRGTETLPQTDGIEIVGGVEDEAEDAFFDSVRAIAMPYGKRSPYGMGYPASGVMSRAIAYGTPVICSDHGALGDMTGAQGITVLRGLPEDDADAVADAFAGAIRNLLPDTGAIATAGENVRTERAASSGAEVAKAFAAAWTDMLGHPG